MPTKTFLLILFSLIGVQTTAQSLKKMVKNALNRDHLTLNSGDTVSSIHVLRADAKKKVTPHLDRNYFWYANNQVKTTQGGYSGRLLGGEFMLYNQDKDLLEKGVFKKGLKVNTWIRWYENGNIKKTERWHKGKRSGELLAYSEKGTLTGKYNYKNNALHGISWVYDDQGKATKLKYKRGKLMPEKKAATPKEKVKQPKGAAEKKGGKKLLPKIKLPSLRKKKNV